VIYVRSTWTRGVEHDWLRRHVTGRHYWLLLTLLLHRHAQSWVQPSMHQQCSSSGSSSNTHPSTSSALHTVWALPPHIIGRQLAVSSHLALHCQQAHTQQQGHTGRHHFTHGSFSRQGQFFNSLSIIHILYTFCIICNLAPQALLVKPL